MKCIYCGRPIRWWHSRRSPGLVIPRYRGVFAHTDCLLERLAHLVRLGNEERMRMTRELVRRRRARPAEPRVQH